MLDPRDLYEIEVAPQSVTAPVLVHTMQGFVDAGHAGEIVSDHLLRELDSQRLVTFDVDQLYDYRSRRPSIVFDSNSYSEYCQPELVIDVVRDMSGVPFLLLHGAEPDMQWERFVAAVAEIVEDYHVSMTVGIHGVPMGVPHTRPLSSIAHANRSGLLGDEPTWLGPVQLPASLEALLELRLGERGHDALGYAVHVPHYLNQIRYPQAAEALLQRVESITGLSLPVSTLAGPADQARAEIDKQVRQSEEVSAVVRALEEQYDAVTGANSGPRPGLVSSSEDLPTADEIGAEVERYLQSQGGTEPQ